MEVHSSTDCFIDGEGEIARKESRRKKIKIKKKKRGIRKYKDTQKYKDMGPKSSQLTYSLTRVTSTPYYNQLQYSQVIYNGTNCKYKQIQRQETTEGAGIVKKNKQTSRSWP